MYRIALSLGIVGIAYYLIKDQVGNSADSTQDKEEDRGSELKKVLKNVNWNNTTFNKIQMGVMADEIHSAFHGYGFLPPFGTDHKVIKRIFESLKTIDDLWAIDSLYGVREINVIPAFGALTTFTGDLGSTLKDELTNTNNERETLRYCWNMLTWAGLYPPLNM
jgi:hypothetical protein